MDDSGSFFDLPILEVPDVCDNITQTLHDGTSVMNHDGGIVEGSSQTQGYGVRKQGSRSGRHTSSLCSTARTLRTDDFITDADINHSMIANLSHNDAIRNHITTTTKRNETERNNTNVPTGRKTPSVVNVFTNEFMNYNDVNDELTTDGNSNTHESVKIIQGLGGVIKYFGLSKYTSSNIATKQEREYENNLDEKNNRKYTQMVNISSVCIKHVRKSICPGPSRRQL